MISFSKYHGAGNDFLIVKGSLHRDEIIQLCHRQFGVGADGIILDKGDDSFCLYNADGSRADMCGNGARCFAQYLWDRGSKKRELTLQADAGPFVATPSERGVTIAMEWPIEPPREIDLNPLTISYVVVGVPHAILFVKELDKRKISEVGPLIRHHQELAPHGANVNFVVVHSHDAIEIATYERGVEGVTLACGTGASAAAIATLERQGRERGQIDVTTPSQEILTITYDKPSLSMSGPACHVFDGVFHPQSVIF